STAFNLQPSTLSRLRLAPAATPVGGEEFFGLGRPPTARLVIGVRTFGVLVLPNIENRHQKLPALLHLIATRKERRITQHAIEQESFVCFGRMATELSAVLEIHMNVADVYGLTRQFSSELERHSFIRLDAQHKHVRFDLIRLRLTKEQVRHALELDCHFRDALRQTLAGAYIERNACPTPIVDHK